MTPEPSLSSAAKTPAMSASLRSMLSDFSARVNSGSSSCPEPSRSCSRKQPSKTEKGRCSKKARSVAMTRPTDCAFAGGFLLGTGAVSGRVAKMEPAIVRAVRNQKRKPLGRGVNMMRGSRSAKKKGVVKQT